MSSDQGHCFSPADAQEQIRRQLLLHSTAGGNAAFIEPENQVNYFVLVKSQHSAHDLDATDVVTQCILWPVVISRHRIPWNHGNLLWLHVNHYCCS